MEERWEERSGEDLGQPGADEPDSPYHADDLTSRVKSTDNPGVDPRLSVRHLLIMVACVAAYLSAIRTVAHFSGDSPKGFLEPAMWTVVGVGRGIGLAGLVFLCVWRAKERLFPRYGGEMLWCLAGIQALLSIIQSIVLTMAHTSEFGAAIFLFQCLQWAVGASAYLYAIVQVNTRRWRIVLVAIAAAGLATLLFTYWMAMFRGALPSTIDPATIHTVPRLLAVGCIAAAARVDLREQPTPPWSHWIGILLYILDFLTVAVWIILD